MYLILNLVNLLLCLGWGWAAMCRLSAIHGMVLIRYQVLYLFMFVAAFVCGFQFFMFGTFAGWPDVIASTVILSLMLVGTARWRHGPPDETLSGPAPLES
jgi:hypothetical protein